MVKAAWHLLNENHSGTSLQWLSEVLKVFMEKANLRLQGFAQNSVL
jgi:hypothetical protein